MINNNETDNRDHVFRAYLTSISRYKLLSHEQEAHYSKRILKGDREALDVLVNSNLRLVIKIAKGYITSEMGLMDVIQEGNMGLLTAAEKFDCTRDIRFSTYASWWVKQSIIRAISNKRRIIRLPHRKEEALRQLQLASEEYIQTFAREPSISELAEYAKIPEDKVASIMSLQGQVVSLDSEAGQNSGTLLDILEDDSYAPDTKLEKSHMKKDAHVFLRTLRERERKVIRYRYAFDTPQKQTLKSIGDELGISPETVRQIELKALRKLRSKFEPLKPKIMI